MRSEKDQPIRRSGESGAALVTVLLVSVLLVTASAAMLSAVGASSKNKSDALAEAKAYWAAESGLQATINVLRYGNVTYAQANADPTLATWLPYTDGLVTIGPDEAYSVFVTDPDDAGEATTYYVTGSFQQADGTYATTRVFGTVENNVTLSFNDVANTEVLHPMTSGTSFGSFAIQSTGTGGTMSSVRFKIDYRMVSPRPAVRSFRGTISETGAVTFDTYVSTLMGSDIVLCGTSDCSAPGPFALNLPAATTTSQNSATVYGQMEPIEPYRLQVVATGIGPNGARKQLESIMQRNFFNDIGSSSAIAMIGTGPGIFRPGESRRMDIDGGIYPSVGTSDPTVLTTVEEGHTNGTMSPPPEVLGDEIPSWQQSTNEMNDLINQLRTTAQNSGRYFGPGETVTGGWGSFDAGTGITFCDGSCTLGGNTEGGGILVVTGTLTTSGSPKFKGLILAVGPYRSDSDPGGITRGGGGTELFIGSIVIAPYFPEDLAAGFQSPRYYNQGGAGEFEYSDVALNTAFGGTAAISNFMLGIAEK